ncbi:unnamed protein product [Boreogadus saida]
MKGDSFVAPSIHEMKSHGVGLGRTALLRCEAAAVPVPIFEWYKGEKRIIKGQGIDIKNLSSRSVLTVNNMTEDRYGNYTCVATNKIGSANASVPLIRGLVLSYPSSLALVSCLRSLDCLIVFIRMAVMSHSKGRSTANLLPTLTSLTHC